MTQLQRKIDSRKRAINDKKRSLKHNYDVIKDKMALPGNLSLTTLGAFVVGFMFLPKKKRLLKLLLKTYTVVTTAKQFLDFLPEHHDQATKRRRVTRTSK